MNERENASDGDIIRVLEAVLRMRGAAAPDGEAASLEEIIPEMEMMLRIVLSKCSVRGEELMGLLQNVLENNPDRFIESGTSEKKQYLCL